MREHKEVIKMVNTELLKKTIWDKGMTIDGVATDIGIDPSTLFRKLQNGGSNFTVAQVSAIGNKLHLSKDEVNNIFFA